MAKDAFWFPHDCNARHDPALSVMYSEFGMDAYGCFFMTIEMLREQNEYKFPLKFKPALLFSWVQIPTDRAEKIFQGFIDLHLLKVDDKFIWSESLCERMSYFDETKKIKIESGRKGGLQAQENMKSRRSLEGALKEPSSTLEAIKDIKDIKDINNKKDSSSSYVAFEQATLTAWNSFCEQYPNLSKIISMSGKRRTHLKERFSQASFKEFAKIIQAIPTMPFLLGQNDRSWVISFDWLICNDTNHLKVLEGKYGQIKAIPALGELEQIMNERGIQPKRGSGYGKNAR